MITKQQAMIERAFYHRTLRNADGTAVRCRASGACKTWKTRPDDFRLPVKYGLKQSFYLTPSNAHAWLLGDITELEAIAKQAGFASDIPLLIVCDWLDDHYQCKEAAYWRSILA